ncbi:MAG: VOC family protein [Candidatus Cloacimonetes bacterium]|nr:VOC family protein [Candidatus Cloacimonadota bacterium]
MTGKLHHVELYVRDLKTSLSFWSWLLERLGYTLFQEWDAGASYILDGTYIVFVQAEQRWLDIPYHRCRAGLNHLAFCADRRDCVDELTSELRARGVTILYEDRHPFAGGDDYYAVFFEDPDRMKVEITAVT